MNPEDLARLILERKWVGIAAVGIYLAIRLLKNDTRIPFTIPPRVRVWATVGLGAAAGVLNKATNMQGVTWTTTAIEGLTAAGLAILFHVLVIDSVRDGKEFVVPGLILPGVPPGPGKPPSIPPTATQVEAMKEAQALVLTPPPAPTILSTPLPDEEATNPSKKLPLAPPRP